MARKSSLADRTSTATTALQDGWKELRRIIPGLPRAAMSILDIDARLHKYGHFANGSWETRRRDGKGHEVAVSPHLFTMPEQLLETLVHEAAHAVLFEEDPKCKEHHGGCSRADKYYHLSVFRDKCVELGLECEMVNRRYGFARTAWPETGVPERYRDVLALLKTEMPLGAKPYRKRKPPQWNPNIRLDCQCDPPRVIYAPRNAATTGRIRCEMCNAEFRPFRKNATSDYVVCAGPDDLAPPVSD